MKEIITVVGLGYVGLPLAVEFSKKYPTYGFDISKRKIDELRMGIDRTLQYSKDEIGLSKLKYIEDIKEAAGSNFYIITAPTPIDKNKKPDMSYVLSATKSVAGVLKSGDIVVYESTVYPGATEEECVPLLEKISGLKYNQEFFVGFSPERINPGDNEHSVTRIIKVTSGSTPEIAIKIDNVYKSIITAGTYLAPSIKVAEAAKVIENSQRDINIAFVNELALIFNRMNIDTTEVLKAASTKWNFLPFTPGLVGGHCIGVDPFYLTHKAQELGYYPEIILAGRRMNDNMGKYVAGQVVKLMIKKGNKISGDKVLVLGVTFKENCPDSRNSKVIDLIDELKEFGCGVDIFDPVAYEDEVFEEYQLRIINNQADLLKEGYCAIILAVSHSEFKDFTIDKHLTENGVVYDIKSFFDFAVDGRL